MGVSLLALLVLLFLLVFGVLVYRQKRSSAAKGGATGSDLHKFPNLAERSENICVCVFCLDPPAEAEFVAASQVRPGGFGGCSASWG